MHLLWGNCGGDLQSQCDVYGEYSAIFVNVSYILSISTKTCGNRRPTTRQMSDAVCIGHTLLFVIRSIMLSCPKPRSIIEMRERYHT